MHAKTHNFYPKNVDKFIDKPKMLCYNRNSI